MLTKVLSAAVLGIDAYAVEVEVDVAARGLPHFNMVGLPDAAVKESKDRVRAALKNIGFNFPLRPITVNLAPADLKKEGSSFDLPIAVGLSASESAVPVQSLAGYIFYGELSLDGRLKPVRGSLSVAILCRELGLKLIVPQENAAEAAVISGVDVYGASSLPDVIGFLRGDRKLVPVEADLANAMNSLSAYEEDFSDVKGQEYAKRALEVAATGGHNVLMIGPPGSGKTMLSKRLTTILPPISLEESLETTRVHSVAGLMKNGQPIVSARPFRAPHHTISTAALVGGGQSLRPGEVSIAHNGVLFLDELPEFNRSSLEALRQPIENQEVTVARAMGSVTYPARFMLVSAMNPCPCGYLGDPKHQCSCTAGQIHRYRARVSGPLMDRIDIHIDVPAVPYKDLSSIAQAEDSTAIRDRVMRAREIQQVRYKDVNIYSNSQMSSRHIKKYCVLAESASSLMETAMKRLGLSARAYNRVLKLSRTIADLDASEQIKPNHVSEAIQYRTLDRRQMY